MSGKEGASPVIQSGSEAGAKNLVRWQLAWLDCRQRGVGKPSGYQEIPRLWLGMTDRKAIGGSERIETR